MKKLSILLPVVLFFLTAVSSLQACTTKGAPDLSHFEEELTQRIKASLKFLFIRDDERHIPEEGFAIEKFKKLNGWKDGEDKYVMEINYNLTLIKEPSEFGSYAGSKRGTLRSMMDYHHKGDTREIQMKVTFRKTEKGWKIDNVKDA